MSHIVRLNANYIDKIFVSFNYKKLSNCLFVYKYSVFYLIYLYLDK